MELLKNCPICKGTTFSPWFSGTDYVVSRETFSIVSCETCGFKFTNPRPVEKEIGKYYESENYIYHSNKKKGLFLQVYHLVRNYAINKKVKLINSLTNSDNERYILDYGCGTGEFLNACKKNGWKTKGIEVSPIARKYGSDYFKLDIEDLPAISKIKDRSIDIITLWHVLEHVHRLKETILELRRILKPEGRILIAVPNCSSEDASYYGKYWAAYDLPRHLSHFTPEDIQNLFSSHDMKVEKMLPLFFDAFYVSMLSEKYKSGSMNYISGLFHGLKSNLKAMNNKSRFSSLIYVCKNK